MFQNLLWVALGGTAGAVARYLAVNAAVNHFGAGASPLAIMAVNVAGCFVIGIVLGMPNLKPQLGLFLAVGFCGGLTTFSTLIIDLITLYQTQGMAAAAQYLALSILLGLGAALVGLWLGKRFV
jgi:CrcB protein